MDQQAQNILVTIEDEMQKSYVDYAMSVIIGRALPDVRDGLKPVHRRVLYAMYDLKNSWNSSYKKSARIVGDVIGKYHPHGDQAVYDTMVRMAQNFSMRYPLIDGQGNFGSVDGDPAAAMRYTEVRMAKLASELLADLDKETVNFGPNYDDSLQEPLILPTKVPNLLVNGTSGIAVGMATNIPPHNLREVVAATIYLIENPDADVADLMEFIPGPDFPTAGLIFGTDGIRQAYNTGRGIIQVRARTHVEEINKDREAIIVTELPYQVNKARLIEKIAEMVTDKRLDGISDLRDESDRDGMRIVIELKRDAFPDIVLNQLYKTTQLQDSFGINMLALVGGQPRVLGLKEIITHFVEHRKEVVTRRCRYELRKAEERAHILQGLIIALDNIDEIIALIKSAPGPKEAKASLMGRFGLSDVQAQAILDMRLQRLTGLERDKIHAEFDQLMVDIGRLKAILADKALLLNVIVEELKLLTEQFGDGRRTEIVLFSASIDEADLIPEEDMVVTITKAGYVKRISAAEYQAQHRGGKGKAGLTMKEEDVVTDLFVASTHSHIMIFTSAGRVFLLKVYELPKGSRTARGKAIVNLLPLEAEERLAAVLPVPGLEEGKFVFFATEQGVVKKTDLMLFKNIRANGIRALRLDDDDRLVCARLLEEGNHVILATAGGMLIRFDQEGVRAMGRDTRGVRGISLFDDDRVIGMEVVDDSEASILTICENGFGKQTKVGEFRSQQRAGKGLICIRTGERNGDAVGILLVSEGDQAFVVTDRGKLIRVRVDDIRESGRATMGVKIINLDDGEKVVTIAKVFESEENTTANGDVEGGGDADVDADDGDGGGDVIDKDLN